MTKPQSMPEPVAGTVITPTCFRPPSRGSALPRLQIAWLPLLVSAVLLLWALAAWFVFTARTVTLSATPSHASISVADGLAPHFGNHWLMRPGPHRVRVSAPGYQAFDALVTVDDAQIQTREVTLERLPGHLRIALIPAVQAEVLVDNVVLGKAPGVVHEIAAGKRQIEIRAARYRPLLSEVEIEGKGIEQSLAGVLEPAWADYSIASQPAGATLSIDEQQAGTTPLSGELLEGRRVLKLTRAGYKPWRQTLKVVAGTAVKLGTVVLIEADGQLELTSVPPGVSVTLDDNFVGRTPLNVAVAPGQAHRLHLLAEGYLAAVQSLTLAAAATQKLNVTLEPELADVRFITLPPSAELLIDGAPRGAANQTLALATREHEVMVRAVGYATYTTKVTPRKGVEKRFKIRLKTIAEAGADELAATPVTTAAPGEVVNTTTTTTSDTRADDAASGDEAPAAPSVTTDAGQELKLFTGGQVVLGSPRSDAARRADEVERQVALKRAFYLGAKEVTNGEFRRFLANHQSPPVNNASLDDDSQPVVDVDWQMAALYCNWLSRRDGLPPFYQIKFGEVLGVNPAASGYRLPTEAEWEWAARVPPVGAATVFAWGDRYPPQGRSGNYADESAPPLVKGALRGFRDGYAVSAPVGSFSPNLRGLYDLGGNVAEWVNDYYDAAPPAIATVDPLGPPSGTRHVIKGASWAQGSATELRLSYRAAGQRGRNDVGFRLARYAQ